MDNVKLSMTDMKLHGMLTIVVVDLPTQCSVLSAFVKLPIRFSVSSTNNFKATKWETMISIMDVKSVAT
jgi:hypothetical protein